MGSLPSTPRVLWKSPGATGALLAIPRGLVAGDAVLDPDTGRRVREMPGCWDKAVVALSPEILAGSFSGYDRDVPGLFLLDRRTGKRVGEIGDDVWGARVDGDVVYAHGAEGVGACTASGDKLWWLDIPVGAIVAAGGRLFVRGPDASVTCLAGSAP